MLKKVKHLLKKIDVDRAVFFFLSARIWALLAGPLTALLIAIKFSPVLQGYYFTFLNLLSLQVFIELGFGYVIVQFASHEWAKLELSKNGAISGDKNALSRLTSLAGFALKWYLAAGFAAAIILSVGGCLFFSNSADTAINWTLPWLSLSLITGFMIFLVFIWALLEGCNQVAPLYAFRLVESVFSNISLWLAILFGVGLWAPALSDLTVIICGFTFLRWKYWDFVKALLFSRPAGPHIHWKKDVLPMQWRFALSGMSSYFIFFFFTPALFHFQGPVVAGQFGMTWSLVGAISAISYSWLAPKVPRFGMLIAQKQYKELDELFKRLIVIIIGLTSFLAVGVWLLVVFLNILRFPLIYRLLPPLPTGILLVAQIITTASIPFSSYLRAHKKEPLLFLSIMAGLMTAIATVTLGKRYSATGVAFGYLLVNSIITPSIIMLWYRLRKKWHAVDFIEPGILPEERI